MKKKSGNRGRNSEREEQEKQLGEDGQKEGRISKTRAADDLLQMGDLCRNKKILRRKRKDCERL